MTSAKRRIGKRVKRVYVILWLHTGLNYRYCDHDGQDDKLKKSERKKNRKKALSVNDLEDLDLEASDFFLQRHELIAAGLPNYNK